MLLDSWVCICTNFHFLFYMMIECVNKCLSLTSVSSKIGLSLESIELSFFKFALVLPASIHSFFQSPSVKIDLVSDWMVIMVRYVWVYARVYVCACVNKKKNKQTMRSWSTATAAYKKKNSTTMPQWDKRKKIWELNVGERFVVCSLFIWKLNRRKQRVKH